MESNKKYGYLIQWLIGIGDLIVLNILFFIVYYGLNSIHTLAITGSLREVVLLLNFCYFFSLYFVPLRLHLSIVFIDKIVQRAFFLVTIMFFLFATCLIFLNVGDVLATFLLVYYAFTLVVFSCSNNYDLFKIIPFPTIHFQCYTHNNTPQRKYYKRNSVINQ